MDAVLFWTVDDPDPRAQAIAPYLAHLRALPFVRQVTLANARSINDPDATALTLETRGGAQQPKERAASLRWFKSHLTSQLVDHVIDSRLARAQRVGEPDTLTFVFAPKVGSGSAQRFSEANINFVDLAGNCRVRIGDEFIAQIEGRRANEKTPRQRTLRAPSVLVLFTLLADPSLIDQPVRAIAEAADGVSPQTVSDLRKRMVSEEWIQASGRGFLWTPRGKERALDVLLANYEQLMLHLQLGRFRLRPDRQAELERELSASLPTESWAFGGGAALERMQGVPELEALTEFYRGTRTIVYLDGDVPKLPQLLVPDEQGEVIFSRFPGKRARPGGIHLSPVLIYLDLMAEGEPRAREAAQELRDLLFQESV